MNRTSDTLTLVVYPIDASNHCDVLVTLLTFFPILSQLSDKQQCKQLYVNNQQQHVYYNNVGECKEKIHICETCNRYEATQNCNLDVIIL